MSEPNPKDTEANDVELGIKRNITGPLMALVVFLGLLGAVAYFVLFSFSVSEDKILIAVTVPDTEGGAGQWWVADEGGEASLRFVNKMAEPLDKVGFTVISPRDEDVLKALEGASSTQSLVEAARKLGAGVLIHGTLATTEESVIAEGEAFELILEGDLGIELTGQEAPDVKTIPMRRLQTGPDRQDAIRLAAVNAAGYYFDEIVAAIMTMPEIDALFDKATRTPEQAQVAAAIKPAYNFVELRTTAIAKRDESIANAEARFKDQDAGPVSIKQHSPFGREDYLVGVLPSNSGVVATVKDRRFYMNRNTLALQSQWLPERQDMITPEGASTTVFEAYNIFGYPSVSRAGNALAIVTDDHGHRVSLRTLTMDPKTGEPSKARLVHSVPRGYLAFPQVSPDGKRVLFKNRECRRCNGNLEVINLDGTGHKVLFKGDDWSSAGDSHWVGAGSNKVAFVIWQTETRGRKFVLLDIETGKQKTIHENDDENQYINENVSVDGTLVSYIHGGPEGRMVTVRSLVDDKVRPVVKDIYTKRPRISHDNRYLAFEATDNSSPKDRRRNDFEIAVVDLSYDGQWPQVHYMTVNDLKDRHLRWAPDRLEIYFETVYEDPDDGEPWVAIRSIDPTQAIK